MMRGMRCYGQINTACGIMLYTFCVISLFELLFYCWFEYCNLEAVKCVYAALLIRPIGNLILFWWGNVKDI